MRFDLNINAHHRSRLRKRFLTQGLNGFEAHNVLELLLFYSIPRQDTNPLAHRLIERFGSLSRVFDAPYEELLSVEGIGENSATLIKMIPHLARRYITDSEKSTAPYDTAKKLGEFFVGRFIGETVEVVLLAMLDYKYGMIDCIELHRGSVNSSYLNSRLIIEQMFSKRAALAVLAHNHPYGMAIPSQDDIHTTRMIKQSLSVVDVCLLEHFVVADNRFMPIMVSPSGELRSDSESDLPKDFYADWQI